MFDVIKVKVHAKPTLKVKIRPKPTIKVKALPINYCANTDTQLKLSDLIYHYKIGAL